MLKGLIGLMVCFLPLSALAQTGAIQGHSYLGGVSATTAGLNSTNNLLGIIPSATITVYLTGTQTLATIYSDANNTPLGNPFTSNAASAVNPGGFLFWALKTQGYDIVLSGGIAPNTYPAPVTITAIFPSGGSTLGDQIQKFGPFTAQCGTSNGYALMNSAAVATLPAYTEKCLIPFSAVGAGTVAQIVSGATNILNECNNTLVSSVSLASPQTLRIWSNGTNWEASCPVSQTTIFPVTDYGAVGDCSNTGATTSCTDNTAAIQAAINAAYPVAGAVYLPLNLFQANGPTVYYIAGTLNPKGVGIFGPSSPRGQSQILPASVAIRGAPGKDVFAPGDPTSPGYVTPLRGFNWENFGIVVDDSVDASSSFPHRKPGKTCQDVTLTNSSAVITSTAQCEFVPGDVGQNISATDGTNTLSTTIASVVAGIGFGSTTATMAANWTYSTHANSTVYVSVMGLSTSATIGNCALAYDDTTASGLGGPWGANFDNLQIITTNRAEQNNSCAFFFQGVAGQPYQSHWRNLFSRTDWGFVAVEADNMAAGSTGTNGALGDTNTFNDWFIEANYPWLTYDGGWIQWKGGQIASASWGPQILEYGSVGNEASSSYWQVDNIEFEIASPLSATSGGWRVEGTNHEITKSQIGYNSLTTPAQWDAFASKCDLCYASGTLNVTGRANKLEFSDAADHITVNDTGFGNLCSLGRDYNPNNSIEPSLYRACSAVNSRQQIAFAHAPDFVANGNETTPYNNQSDLWIWPQDMYFGPQSSYPLTPDTASETGAYISVASQAGFNIVNNTAFVIGQSNSGPNLPAQKVHMCIRAKADSGSGTAGFGFQFWLNGSSVASASLTLTASYSTNCMNVDLTAAAGETPLFVVDPSTFTIDVAWISVHPWSDGYNSVGQVLGGSLQVASARKGTFTCTAGGTISISNTNYAATSDVVITMSTAGGTISTAPAMSTVTPGTGFTVLCGAADTSVYNYSILN